MCTHTHMHHMCTHTRLPPVIATCLRGAKLLRLRIATLSKERAQGPQTVAEHT